MSRRSSSLPILLTGLVCLLLPRPAGAQPGANDPWAMVPAFPTSCYVEMDGFPDKYRTALDAVKAARDRQTKINDEVKERANAMDPMEQANKMQEYMMANPEEAMKLMQGVAAAGEAAANPAAGGSEGLLTLQAERMDLEARYKAEVEKAMAPFKIRYAELDVRAQKDLVAVGETWEYAPWAKKEYNAITAELNKSYERVCAGWWGASGTFHGWMNRYKENLVAQVPENEEAEKVGAGLLAILAGTPNSSFKPTSALHFVIQHTEQGLNLFSIRKLRPDGFMNETP